MPGTGGSVAPPTATRTSLQAEVALEVARLGGAVDRMETEFQTIPRTAPPTPSRSSLEADLFELADSHLALEQEVATLKVALERMGGELQTILGARRVVVREIHFEVPGQPREGRQARRVRSRSPREQHVLPAHVLRENR